MLPALQKEWETLRATRQRFLDFGDQYQAAQQHFKPGAEEWSMAEVLEHLVMSEAGTLKFFDKYPPAQSTMRATWQMRWRSFLLNRFLRSRRRTRAPKMVLPKGAANWAVLRGQSLALNGQVAALLEAFPADKLPYSAFKHPLAGPLTMPQCLQFLAAHYEHHLHQLKRIAAHPDFPR